jgi:hypothetical protein
MKLSPNETDLVGDWRAIGDAIEPDETSKRIEQLTRDHLVRLGYDPSGWDTLFADPNDGRFWELTYPSSGSEGGGPPRLTCIDLQTAREKYGGAVLTARTLIASGRSGRRVN